MALTMHFADARLRFSDDVDERSYRSVNASCNRIVALFLPTTESASTGRQMQT